MKEFVPWWSMHVPSLFRKGENPYLASELLHNNNSANVLIKSHQVPGRHVTKELTPEHCLHYEGFTSQVPHLTRSTQFHGRATSAFHNWTHLLCCCYVALVVWRIEAMIFVDPMNNDQFILVDFVAASWTSKFLRLTKLIYLSIFLWELTNFTGFSITASVVELSQKLNAV